jgi:hypothetical protein
MLRSFLVPCALVGCSSPDGGNASTTGTDGAADETANGASEVGSASSGGGDTDGTTSTGGATESGDPSGDPDSSSSAGETTGSTPSGPGCPADWATVHPEWIFCDAFESDAPMVGPGRYFEHDDNAGEFVVAEGVGVDGSRGLQVHWQPGEVGAGHLNLSFGRTPSAYMDSGIRTDEDFREIWYRMMLRNAPGWTGSPAKLSRATVIAADDWSQAMIAHLWSDDAEHLGIDPASCVENGQVVCSGYNDFDRLHWLGFQAGPTPVFATEQAGEWRCIEAHVRLDDPGRANGVQEFWIDGVLEARGEGLEFVGTYADYGINAVFFENYWNEGSPQEQERFFDDIVVSTAPIGCPE